MKILLLSDTHSYLDDIILSHVAQADEVWHAGDIGILAVYQKLAALRPVRAVYGNIDDKTIQAVTSEYLVFDIDGLKFLILHIGGRPGKYPKRAKELMTEHQPDIFICGHSHILKVMKDEKMNLLHINPGAAGQQGFHQVRTMIRFEILEGKLKNAEVIELGKRGAISTPST